MKIFLIFLGLSFLIFGNGITGGFVFDDTAIIENRGELKNIARFWELFISPYHQNMPETGLFRPLTMATYSLNYFLLGPSPVGFHIINIIIHALNSFLVFWLVRYFIKSVRVAYFASVLFLFHPIHTEAVTSIVGRAELLALLFSLACIYFWSKDKKITSLLVFLFGLASKETSLMILPAVFYLDIVFVKKDRRKALSENLLFIYPLAVYAILRYLALGKYFIQNTKTTLVENPLKFADFSERVFTAFNVLFIYIKKLIWPVGLSADYSYNAVPLVGNIFNSPTALLGLMVLCVMVFAILWPKTRATGLGFGAVMFLFPYLIISNFIYPIGTIMGERLIYIPSLGFAVFVALLIEQIVRKQNFYNKIGYGILATIIIFYGTMTIIRNNDWKSNETLFKSTVLVSPNSFLARTGLAAVSIRNDDWAEAEKQLEIARNIHEDNAHLQNLLGILADHKGNKKLAEERFKKSIELNGGAINSYINLIELQLEQKRYEEAGDNILKIINTTSSFKHILQYSFIQIFIGRPDKAIGLIEERYGLNDPNPDINLVLGTAYFAKNEHERALFYLEKAKNSVNFNAETKRMLEISRRSLNN